MYQLCDNEELDSCICGDAGKINAEQVWMWTAGMQQTWQMILM